MSAIIIDSITHLTAIDESMVGECGRAFGAFDAAISDLDVNELKITIPDFHNTRKRYEDFEAAVLKSNIDDASIEVGKYLAIKEEACALWDANLPLRVCHNDTKPSNVLFDMMAKAPFCIAAELGLRYLTDHLNGDKYFKINYKGENLDKARKILDCLDHLC